MQVQNTGGDMTRLHPGWIAGLVTAVLVFSHCSSDRSGTAAEDISTITPQADLRIDGQEHDLVPVTWLGVSPGGQLALIQWQDYNVRFFDESGALLGTVGREGQGPGEFRRPLRGGWIGDTLWVSDPELGRVTLISPTLEVVTAFATPAVARPQPQDADTLHEYRSPVPYGFRSRDTLLATGLMRVDGQAQDPSAGYPMLRVTSSGEIIGQVARIPLDEGLSVTIRTGNGVAFMPIPYFPRSQWVVAPDGKRIAILTTDMSSVETASYRVRVFDELGRVVVDRTQTFEPVRIPQAKMDSAIAATVARRPEMRVEFEAALREAARTYYPEAEQIVLGSDYRIWIGLRATDQGQPWLVHDSEGKPLERVILPGNAMLRAADDTHIWAVERDEFDVESVVRYKLH
jgi:hypothetical protein